MLAQASATPACLQTHIKSLHPNHPGVPANAKVTAATLFPENGDVEAANPPGNPTLVSPRPLQVKYDANSGTVTAALAPRSFSTIVLTATA